MTRADIQALADFLPPLRQPGFTAGKVRGGEQTEPGVFQMPFIQYDPVVDAFVKAAYRHSWVLMDFDWPVWAQSDEAKALQDDETAIAMATPEQLGRLITVCVRQERFCDGTLMSAFDSGLILRVVERAATLVGHPSSDLE
ncbi:UNVERIFIED_ORG: hypothetical protein ABID33_001845 [Xanthobacter viscosus]|uniref:Uncharacterized protein n=1 Tax=Xanthobacter autotrophicus TaxID=280 RepID=A0A6C1KEM3_XANAU|nr:DUF6508 domain-containing protein [Xanthobacter autotrophicus]TLX42622.1 hypothetical protein FBQ73_13370 [Xanthobacter autotrophicus]